MINGVSVKSLRRICDERGYLQEIMRNDDPQFKEFGQVYITTTYPGVVKGWHYHKEQTDQICCIKGIIKLVLYDSREESTTKGEIQEIFLGENNPLLVTVPNMVFHGWKSVGNEVAYILNIPDKTYNYKKPDEIRTNPHNNDIPYDWKIGREIDG